MSNLDPVSPEPKFSLGPNYPDILALQARVHQLEAALKSLKAAVAACPDIIPGITPASDLLMAQVLKLEANTAVEALPTPAPDVSPLWSVLDALLRVAQENQVLKSEELMSSDPYEKAVQALWDKVKALTPELRALIEEMAKGGRE